MSYHRLTRKVIVITHDKYLAISSKKGMQSQYCQQLISLPFVRKKITLASERRSASPRRTSLSCKLYIDPARQTGPATSGSSSPILIEKTPSVWRHLWERLFLYKSTNFSVIDGIDSKHEQESRQSPEDARPTGRS